MPTVHYFRSNEHSFSIEAAATALTSTSGSPDIVRLACKHGGSQPGANGFHGFNGDIPEVIGSCVTSVALSATCQQRPSPLELDIGEANGPIVGFVSFAICNKTKI